MQTYINLQEKIQEFNTLIFGCGFYFYWEYEYPRGMKEQTHNGSSRPKDLIVSSMFDTCYAADYLLCFKRCTQHNLQKDYYIPDSWDKPPIEIIDIQLVECDRHIMDRHVSSFTAKLNAGSGYNSGNFCTITAQGFYYRELKKV